MTIAANDTTTPETIARGTTVESNTWRAHRFDGHIRITSLANAGRRGKTCPIFNVTAPGFSGQSERLEAVAPFVFEAVVGDVSVGAMERALADVVLAGFRLERFEAKGCRVDAAPAIVVNSDLMDATFTPSETLARFTAVHSTPAGGSFRQDTLVGHASRKDAAKAYAWAREHASELPRMTLVGFRAAMGAIGARVG